MPPFTPRHGEVLVREAMQIREFRLLDGAELAQASAALETLEPGAGTNVDVLRRVGRRSDGTYLLGIEFNRFPLDDRDRPWGNNFSDGLATETQYEELATGLVILRSEGSPAKEAERRRALFERHKVELAELRSREAAAEAKRSAEVDAHRRLLRDFDEPAWFGVPHWARAVYRMAIAADQEGMPGFARQLRAIASSRDRDDGPRMSLEVPWKR